MLHAIDKKFLLKAGIVLFVIILMQVGLTQLIGEEVIRQRVEDAGIRAPIVLIAYKTLSVVFAPLSGSVMYVVAGGLFGTWMGIVYGAIGNALGMSFAYRLGHRYGIKAIRWLVGARHAQEAQHLITHLQDKKTFVITRCVLLPLEDLINFASGMARVPFWWFITSSMIIVTALSVLLVFLGDIVM